MQFLDPAETRLRTPYPELVDALAAAVVRLARGQIVAPERFVLPLPDGGRYLVMPAVDGHLAVTKLIAVHPSNPARGLAAIRGRVVVADARSGETLAMLDGPTVTARRTAAMSLLGIRTLLGRPVRRAAIVGAGAQAREHAVALHETTGARIVLAARDAGRARALCDDLAACGVAAEPAAGVAEALRGADVVVCATSSRRPVLPEAVDAATLVVAVGAFTPQMAEVPAALVRSRRVVVDTLDGARHEAGDLIQAGIDMAQVLALDAALGSAPPEAPVLFKTVGHAAWDLAAAQLALVTPPPAGDEASPSAGA